MSFLAQPSDVGPILSRTTYQSLRPGNNTINITIYDGAGGPCPNAAERRVTIDENGHDYTSFHSTCFTVSGIVPVTVETSRNVINGRSIIREVPIQAWVGISGVLLCLLFAIATAVQKRGGFINKRRKGCSSYISAVRFLKRGDDTEKDSHKESSSPSVHADKASQDNDPKKSPARSHKNINLKQTLKRRLSVQWYAFRDQVSGDTYYQNRHTRRVTWTKPREDENLQLISNETSENKRGEQFLEYEKDGEDDIETSSFVDETIENKSSSDCSDDDDDDDDDDVKQPALHSSECVEIDESDCKQSPRWKSYKDESTGDPYFMNKYTRRVTWTEPKEEYEPVDGYLA